MISIVLIPICFLITLFSYTKIYFCLRRQAIQLGTQTQPSATLNGGGATPSQIRYKKPVLSMFYLFCVSILSYLPYLSHKILVGILGWCTSMSALFSFGLTFVYGNSSMDPVIYCWRITKVKLLVTGILCATKAALWSVSNNLKQAKVKRVEVLPT